jgi:putative transposase
MQRKAYDTDLTDEEWAELRPLLPAARRGGRKRSADLREIMNAIQYWLKTGCQWRLLPHEFPPWQTVYMYFRHWKLDGTWVRIHDFLYRKVRHEDGRHSKPSMVILDSQTAKTTEECSEHRGYDAGKKTKGRKRHILVDTLGLLVSVAVHSAGIQDRDGGRIVLDRITQKMTRLEKLVADGAYAGEFIDHVKKTSAGTQRS